MTGAVSDPEVKLMLSRVGAAGGDLATIVDLVLTSVGDGVAISDASGDALYFNLAARRILGLPSSHTHATVRSLGASLYHLNDFSPLPEDELPLVRALRGEVTHDVELFVRSPTTADGTLICMNARPLRDARNNVVGGIAVFHDATARKRAEQELLITNQMLGAWVAELERRAAVSLLMNDMANLLQSCRTLEEFHAVVSRFAGRIFEREPGAIFLVNPSRSAIERVVAWGAEPANDRVFAPDACWALRRGRMHRAGGDRLGPDCGHVAPGASASEYLCIPMMGQGEALGVLHVRLPPDQGATVQADLRAAMDESRLRTTIAVTEHIALALANLRLRETLRMQAIRDPLTGLFNRRYMEESLSREVARAARSASSLAAVMIDIDHFRDFNENFGHAAADLALRETCQLLREMARPEDIACRFGGEELVLIMPDTSVEQAAKRAEEYRLAVADQKLHYQGASLGIVTASFGVAAYPQARTGDELLRAADDALYQAKRGGRNCVCVRELTSPGASGEPLHHWAVGPNGVS
jgi:diguanylate cyclase (GGDEF)-like protein/PAS domain S-box-containing protein